MKITIENNRIRATLNTYAGHIESLVDKKTGAEHYWQYDSARWPRRTSVCFPICGKLIDEQYHHLGKTYSLPMHGFLREMELQVAEREANRLTLTTSSNEETLKNYPFPFRFVLEQSIEENTMRVSYMVENTGSSEMFYSTGAHYTYALPDKQSRCRYWFSEVQHAGSLTQSDGLITGKTSDVFDGHDFLAMDHLFDQASTIVERKDIHTDFIAIGTEKGPFTSVQSEGFEYTVLWAPPGGDSPFACIEPWAGMTDVQDHDGELAHKLGIQRLAAGQKRCYMQRITLHEVPVL